MINILGFSISGQKNSERESNYAKSVISEYNIKVWLGSFSWLLFRREDKFMPQKIQEGKQTCHFDSFMTVILAAETKVKTQSW